MDLSHQMTRTTGRGRRPWQRFGRRSVVPADGQPSWRQGRYCVIDVETTGLDLARDDLVSIGVVEVSGGCITPRTYYQVVRPAAELSVASRRIHCLTSEELKSAPTVAQALPDLCAFIGTATLVAHAAWIERAFLKRALRATRYHMDLKLLDTAALARRLGLADSDDTYEPSLEGLSIAAGLPVHTPHHALGDALTTAQLFIVYAARLEAACGGRVTSEDLAAITRTHGR